MDGRSRNLASLALVMVGAVLLLAGLLAHYARSQVLGEEAFADRADAALADSGVSPPRLRANRPFQKEAFLVRRAHRCARRRGLPVNLIAVDHYDQGGLLEAVARLNREQVRRVRRERQLAAGGS
jgi:hypothetical protein